MKKIGMVVAIEREIRAALEQFGTPKKEEKFGPIAVRTYEINDAELYVAHSGIGEIAASAATQLLISLYHAELILNCGVVGGLTAEMASAKTCVVTSVVHYDVDSSAIDPIPPARYMDVPSIYIPTSDTYAEKAVTLFPELRKAICCSADKFVAEAERKAALHDMYQGDICDMESAGIALTAYRNEVPVLMIKTVADSITGGAEGFEQSCLSTARICMEIALKIIEQL